MDAETRTCIERWLLDPGVDDAAKACLAMNLDRDPEPTLISAPDAAACADMLERENHARIDELLAEYAMERGTP